MASPEHLIDVSPIFSRYLDLLRRLFFAFVLELTFISNFNLKMFSLSLYANQRVPLTFWKY